MALTKQEEKVIDKIITAITDYIQIKLMHKSHPFLFFHFRDLKSGNSNAGYFETGKKSVLPILNTISLCFIFLASNLCIILIRTQIFEAV